jgi:PAS domain S-box-containing protein
MLSFLNMVSAAQQSDEHPVRVATARYIGACLGVALAVYLGDWLQPVLDPSVVLLVAVVVVAWFGGFWPAMFASLFATLALDYFFTAPFHTLRFDFVHIPRLAVFTATAGLFTSVSASRRRAERSLQQIRDELDGKVQQRTADLTRAHGEAIAAQQRFTDLVNSIEGIVWEADARTLQFSFVSEQAQRMLGYPVDNWLRDHAFWKNHIHADDRDRAVDVRLTATTERQKGDSEYRMLASDGRVVWVRDLVNVVVENGHTVRLRGLTFNVTRRKEAEQALEELAGRLIHAQEEERSRIGRELHDHISQMLGVLTIRMDQLRVDGATPASVSATLEELRRSAAEITDDIHGLSHRLHSSALDYLGLVAALERLVTEFSARHGLDIEFSHAEIPETLPSEVALGLFRVTEESLANIAKHSGSKSARVTVTGEAGGIHLTIEDGGKGFDVTSLERKGGLGFVSMRERLRALRGTVHVDSVPARGTRIDALVPARSLDMRAAGEAAEPRAAAGETSRQVSAR